MKKVTMILITFVSFILCGLAILNLWNWFIVPLGVISITFWHAVGIDVLFTLITTTGYRKVEHELEQSVYMIILPLLSLGFGWIAHMFI